MSADTIPACPLALTAEELSRFRDGDVPADHADVIADHLASCPACAARLAEYEHTGAGLRSIPEPALDDRRFWRDLALRMSAHRPARAAAGAPLRRAFTGLGAVAAVLLIALGFAQLFALHSSRPTARAKLTPTVTPLRPLVWQKVQFPGEWATRNDPATKQVPSIGGAALAFTPAAGNMVYGCHTNISGNMAIYQIWVTRDRASSWNHASELPTSQAGACSLVADAAQPTFLIAQTTWYLPGAGPLNPSVQSFVSTNGGQTWRQLAGTFSYFQLATHQGTTYALVQGGADDPDRRFQLIASTDGLNTWHQADAKIQDANDTVGAFWLNPNTGALLADGYNGSAHTLWQSPDGGHTWTRLSHPDVNPLDIVVQQPDGDAPWNICVADQLVDNPARSYNRLECTSDGGNTWADRSALNISLTCDRCKGGPLTEISRMHLIALAADGSILAQVADGYTTEGAGHNSLYRLTPGSSTWESLGELPTFAIPKPLALARDGTLWAPSWGGDNQADLGYGYVTTYP